MYVRYVVVGGRSKDPVSEDNNWYEYVRHVRTKDTEQNPCPPLKKAKNVLPSSYISHF